MSRVYFHIDLNAFFANAEILLDPSLAGKPIAVAGSTRRSVISTCSYEARVYGVHSAMPVSEARRLCPQLILLEGHYTWYSELSKRFMSIVHRYTEDVEQASVDECYADVTEIIRRYPRPLDLATELQQTILRETGIPCSIGVGPNMMLAKMASDMKKPMGITVLRLRDVPQKMWPLPIGDLRGIGSRTVPLLEEAGIHTIGELANPREPAKLREIFGKNTDHMIRKAQGYDDRVLVREYDARSMGVSETMLEDVTDYEELRGLFRVLARRLSSRLKKSRKAGSLLQIRICYFDFRNIDRSAKMEHPICRSDDLFVQAMSLFDSNWDGDPVRLIGISVSDFSDENAVPSRLNLFNEDMEDDENTEDILADLNRQLGTASFHRASALLKKEKDA